MTRRAETKAAAAAAIVAAASACWLASRHLRRAREGGSDLRADLDEVRRRLAEVESELERSRSREAATTRGGGGGDGRRRRERRHGGRGRAAVGSSGFRSSSGPGLRRLSTNATGAGSSAIPEDVEEEEARTNENVVPRGDSADAGRVGGGDGEEEDGAPLPPGAAVGRTGSRAAGPPQTIVTRPRAEGPYRFLRSSHSAPEVEGEIAATPSLRGGGRDDDVAAASAAGMTGTSAAAARRRRPRSFEPVPVILVSDPGQDLDDEMMFVMARHMSKLDLISLRGVVANLSPSFARARLTRGTLDLLGLHRVPVGIGTDGGDVAGNHSSDQFETTARSYIVHEDGEAARGLESGHRLLQRLYDAAEDIEYVDEEEADEEDEDDGELEGDEGGRRDSQISIAGNENNDDDEDDDEDDYEVPVNDKKAGKKAARKVVKGGLTIVCTSSLKDMAIFVRDNPTLFASKTREVVIMGGCKPVPPEGRSSPDLLASYECEPDSAHNNTFDAAASAFFYSQCQKMNIALTVVSRYAAYAAKMPRSVYDDLALTGSSIGWRLRNSQRSSIDQLWRRACSSDPAGRKGLPPRCDRKWFIDTFCGGNDDPSRCSVDTAWDLVTGFCQYDTIALLAAIPVVREEIFDPLVLPPLMRTWRSLRIGEEGRALDDSEVSRGDEEREGSAGSTSLALAVPPRRGRRRSCPEPIQRAILRAQEDSRRIETPFDELPVAPAAFDQGTRNLIGLSDKETGLRDPALLVNLLNTGYREGILCNHHTQPHIILHLQLRWDNLADTLLTCLMLRSLWDMRLASVLGVIVSIPPGDSDQAKRPPDGVSVSDMDASKSDGASHEKRASDTDGSDDFADGNEAGIDPCPSTLGALAESIRATLRSIGLSHVKFRIVSGKDLDEHKSMSSSAFHELYEYAPPIGVTLVLTATFTSAWSFAEANPDLFRNKTVRVVHTGGALIWPARWGWAALPNKDDDSNAIDMEDPLSNKGGGLTSEQILIPDPAAQNHRLDMTSAHLFYKLAQALSVPMVILSRHVAKECCIPRNFFDVLGSHGGDVGKRIYENERTSLLNLWRCSCAPVGSAARGNLPERCDKQWFAQTFCAGTTAESEEEVWRSIEAVNLYSPIALLAALPGETVMSYFETMPFKVRSATHHVIGLTEEVPPRNVTNPTELRSLVVQSLLSAALANASEFSRKPPPMVPVRMNHEKRRSGRMMALTSSVISTISTNHNDEVEDMWTFSEAARRELFSRTAAQTSKNAMMPKEKKRKFVMNENLIVTEGEEE